MNSPAVLAATYRAHGRKLTPQRQLIFRLLDGNDSHPSAEALYAIAAEQMPGWMRVLSSFNPVNWGVDAARAVVLPGTDWGAVGMHLGYLLALSVATAAFANWTFRVYKRSL